MDLSQAFVECLKLANEAFAADEVPVGAVVVKEGKIIGRGYNRRESSASPTAHAEILAVEDAARALGSWRLQDCELVVTLEPCLMCLGALQQARIKRVIYGAVDIKGGAVSLGYAAHVDQRLNHRFLVECVRNRECENLLKVFFSRKR